jgi:hypothetical protein
MILAGILLILTICSCGIYSFSGSTLPPHIKTVGIPLFENRTAEFGIDRQVTDLLTEALRKDNTLKIADPGVSDAVLHGVIVGIREQAGQYNSDEEALDYRIYLTIKVSFDDVKNRQTFWEVSFSDFGTYDNDRDAGIEEAIGKISEDIINKTVSDW